MALLVLRSRGWQWSTDERGLLLQGNAASAGIRAADRLRSGAGLSNAERVELGLVVAASSHQRKLVPQSIAAMTESCEIARASSVDLRCLAQAQKVELVAHRDSTLRELDDSLSEMRRFREVFAGGVNRDVLSMMDLVIARAAYALGDVVMAEDALARVQGSAVSDSWIDVWVLVSQAQCLLLHGERKAAYSAAQSAAAATSMWSRVFGTSTLWAALAEIAWACDEAHDAWLWASKSIDASAVRPSDGRASFMPGNLIWGTGA